MQTNITACILTLNEASHIEDTLDSAWPIFDELVILDGDSDDDTVAVCEAWCDEHGIPFTCIESSEWEYLVEGPATQRRRMEEQASCDYTLSIGADVEVEVLDEEWFGREFDHYAYVHTRRKASGRIGRDYRLYCPNPDEIDADKKRPRWRGIIHEEILDQRGRHVSEVYQVAEAPMVHHQRRFGAMDVHSTAPHHQRRHDTRVGGNAGEALKKQHYLLQRALASDRQRAWVSSVYKDYYAENRAIINQHWQEVRDRYELPQEAWNHDDVEDVSEVGGWDLSSGEPIMDYKYNTAGSYLRDKATNALGSVFS
ncbi:glycosyltransferase [Halorussus halophilus]|uniref:glycosyltransferase n=1 Tax=Halorussus halophilus TaxID=2650975 RepID=UPI00130198E8|nr:glycosyltransferase [Halorussus halophilus]